MSPKDQNAAIALACGWTILEPEVHPAITFHWGYPPGIKAGNRSMIPEFVADLNAMNQAEEILENHPTDKPFSSFYQHHAVFRYRIALIEVCDARMTDHHGLGVYCNHQDYKLIRATAAQRAKAFLMALNLYIE